MRVKFDLFNISLLLIAIGGIGGILLAIAQAKSSKADNENLQRSLSSQNDILKSQIEDLKSERAELNKDLRNRDEKNSELSQRNGKLTEELTELSKERFRELTQPEINVLSVGETLNGLDSLFKVNVMNSGNSPCLNAVLVVEEHNSPFAKGLPNERYLKIPQGANVTYSVPIFQVNHAQFFEGELRDEFGKFIDKYNKGEMSAYVKFHIEYEWKGEKLSTPTYVVFKAVNETPFASTI